MTGKTRVQNPIRRLARGTATAMLATTIALAMMLGVWQWAQAQTFTVIHNFTGGSDGANPHAGLTMDKAGNFYGTTGYGGSGTCSGQGQGCGAVFKLAHKGSGWTVSPLYDFSGSNDGGSPWAGVTIAPDGSLYGTTTGGGQSGSECGYYVSGCGVVFNLRPAPRAPTSAFAPWTETVLYSFNGPDGSNPVNGNLIFDQAGNLYGTTERGGPNDGGVVYQLAKANGTWSEAVLHNFPPDGNEPFGGVIFDKAGNLYGATYSYSGPGYGAVYQLVPSGSGWTENTLYDFQGGNDGGHPYNGLIFDQAGNLYGGTLFFGSGGGGVVYQLVPSNGSWIYKVLYSFTGGDLCGVSGLVMDQAGNLYGTTYCDGAYRAGSVFKLTPSNGGWTYTSLHDFCAGGSPCVDGAFPDAGVTIDANGNFFGTTFYGGTSNYGVIWEITP